jgi:hypothetical protein
MPRQSVTTPLRVETSLEHVFMPGCRACGHKHPKAYMPPLDTDACPGCGAPVAKIREERGLAIIHDLALRIGAALLAGGRWLFGLSQKV